MAHTHSPSVILKRQAVRLMLQGQVNDYLALLMRKAAERPSVRA